MIPWLAVWALVVGPIQGPAPGSQPPGPPGADDPVAVGVPGPVPAPATAWPAASIRAPWLVARSRAEEVPVRGSDRWLAEDKAQHFAMSFAATGMWYGAARLALEPVPARATAVGAAVAMGVGKELWDVTRGGPFSVKDLFWDALGVALGYTLLQRMD